MSTPCWVWHPPQLLQLLTIHRRRHRVRRSAPPGRPLFLPTLGGPSCPLVAVTIFLSLGSYLLRPRFLNCRRHHFPHSSLNQQFHILDICFRVLAPSNLILWQSPSSLPPLATVLRRYPSAVEAAPGSPSLRWDDLHAPRSTWCWTQQVLVCQRFHWMAFDMLFCGHYHFPYPLNQRHSY